MENKDNKPKSEIQILQDDLAKQQQEISKIIMKDDVDMIQSREVLVSLFRDLSKIQTQIERLKHKENSFIRKSEEISKVKEEFFQTFMMWDKEISYVKSELKFIKQRDSVDQVALNKDSVEVINKSLDSFSTVVSKIINLVSTKF